MLLALSRRPPLDRKTPDWAHAADKNVLRVGGANGDDGGGGGFEKMGRVLKLCRVRDGGDGAAGEGASFVTEKQSFPPKLARNGHVISNHPHT